MLRTIIKMITRNFEKQSVCSLTMKSLLSSGRRDGFGQDSPDDFAVGLHEAFQERQRAAHGPRAQVNLGQLDERVQEVVPHCQGCLSHRRPGNTFIMLFFKLFKTYRY